MTIMNLYIIQELLSGVVACHYYIDIVYYYDIVILSLIFYNLEVHFSLEDVNIRTEKVLMGNMDRMKCMGEDSMRE